jgi:transposase
MLSEASAERVYLALGATDLKKSINGLAAIVQEQFKLNPFSSCLFVFCNYRRDKIKILYWDHNGFWLYYRRLEKGKFKWPKEGEGPLVVSRRQLRWLLDGLSLEQQQAHPKVTAGKTV